MPLQQCEIITTPKVIDPRGAITFIEGTKRIPFAIKRVYYLYNLSNELVRGDHAHKKCQRFLIAIHGSFDIMLDDGQATKKITLDKPDVGLYVPAMIWSCLENFSQGAVCLVLTDQLYDADDYIRHHPEFLTAVKTATK